jgi:hypothetical protein
MAGLACVRVESKGRLSMYKIAWPRERADQQETDVQSHVLTCTKRLVEKSTSRTTHTHLTRKSKQLTIKTQAFI